MYFFLGKFAQGTNVTKVELIKDPQVFFDYLMSDEINMLDARFVSGEIIEIHYENNENFIAPNAKTNVVIAAFTTAYARLKLYGVLDMLQERVLYYDTDSVIPTILESYPLYLLSVNASYQVIPMGIRGLPIMECT